MSAIRASSPARRKAYLKQTGVGDTAVFGPEAEFFVFDDVRFAAEPFNCGYKIDSIELPTNMDTEYEMGNLGHRPRTKGGYFPVPPIDSAQDLRSEMLARHGRHGRRHREASPRSGRRAARARHQVRTAGEDRRRDADLQIRDPPGGAGLRQDRDASCRSRFTATTARACTPTSRSGRAASRCSPATNTPTFPTWRCTTSPAS